MIFKNIPYYLTGLPIFFLLFKSGLCLASSPKLEIGILFSLPHNVQEESQKLSGEVTRRLIAHFPENPPKNIPHISLFQLKIEESRLPELIENLGVFLKKNPFLPTLTMRSSLTDTQENIFWTVERIDDETNLNDFHKSIVEIAAAYRSSELMEQVRMLRNLSLDQREKVKNYGIFWGLPGNLNPHITLFYDSGVDRKDQNKTFISIKDLIGEIAVTPGIVFKAQSLAMESLGVRVTLRRSCTNLSESLISRSHFGKPRPKRANSGYGESRDILWLCRALKNAFSLKQVKMYTGLSEDSLNKFLH